MKHALVLWNGFEREVPQVSAWMELLGASRRKDDGQMRRALRKMAFNQSCFLPKPKVSIQTCSSHTMRSNICT